MRGGRWITPGRMRMRPSGRARASQGRQVRRPSSLCRIYVNHVYHRLSSIDLGLLLSREVLRVASHRAGTRAKPAGWIWEGGMQRLSSGDPPGPTSKNLARPSQSFVSSHPAASQYPRHRFNPDRLEGKLYVIHVYHGNASDGNR